jgi:hypothetical protein
VFTHPGEGEVVQREHGRDALPITHAREGCLLGHGTELQRALVAATAMRVAVDAPAAVLASEPH